ncbi:MAG: LysR family transcriptional regulator [Sphingomonadales bacterium]
MLQWDLVMRDLRDIDLNLLVVFDAIYSAGNVSEAARNMGVSQPTISNALGRLRSMVDDRLFMRSGRGVSPTPKAMRLIGPTRQALQLIYAGLCDDDYFNPARSKREFRIIVAEPLEPFILPALINDLPSDSQVSFDYALPMSQNIEQGLLTDRFELAVFLKPPKMTELCVEPLCPVDLVAIARLSHPRLGKRRKLTNDDLKNEKHIGLNLRPGRLANMEKINILEAPIRRHAARVSSVGAIARIVGQTDLIGMVPRVYANAVQHQYGLKLLELSKTMNDQQFFMIWGNRHNNDAGHQWLRDRIRALVRNDHVQDGGA